MVWMFSVREEIFFLFEFWGYFLSYLSEGVFGRFDLRKIVCFYLGYSKSDCVGIIFFLLFCIDGYDYRLSFFFIFLRIFVGRRVLCLRRIFGGSFVGLVLR